MMVLEWQTHETQTLPDEYSVLLLPTEFLLRSLLLMNPMTDLTVHAALSRHT